MESKGKMKLSDRIITSIIILAIIAGGGYYVYKHFILEPQNNDIPDVEGIETYEVWNRNYMYGEGGYYELIGMVSAMENSEANFFLGEPHPEYSQFLSISQTNKATFENTIDRVSLAAIIQRAIDDMKIVFDSDFAKFTNDLEDYQIDAIEEYDGFPLEAGGNMMYNNGDEGLALYLMNHEVKLKCESVKINKVAAANLYDRDAHRPIAAICVIGTAMVTTEYANGDISELGLFGNQGETVTINFAGKGDITGNNMVPGGLICFTLERAEE